MWNIPDGKVVSPLDYASHERNIHALSLLFLWDDPVDVCMSWFDLCDFCVSSDAAPCKIKEDRWSHIWDGGTKTDMRYICDE